MKPLSKFFALMLLSSSGAMAQTEMSLQQAIDVAHTNDPWLHGSRLRQQALEHQSTAANTLEDPVVNINMMNVPTDRWDLSQEAMTQFKVGVSQRFSRGDTLELKSKQLALSAEKQPLLRQDRKAKVAAVVSGLWLDAFLAQQTLALIEADWALFEQMAEVAKASYSNALGSTRQQDVIRSQLEILQLQDRLTAEKQNYETAIARLNQWLHRYDEQSSIETLNFDQSLLPFKVTSELPNVSGASDIPGFDGMSRTLLAQHLNRHPAVLVVENKHKVMQSDVEVAKQAYKPQWGVNASYGFRDNAPSGDRRADLFSVGVSFDLPLFASQKQDKQVAAAVAQSHAVKTEKLLLIKQMLSEVERQQAKLKRTSQRQALYQQQLLLQTHEQAEAALTAYTNDDGDFAEVVRARIAELNARIAALKIDVDRAHALVQLNYLFTQAQPSEISPYSEGINK